jgi:mannitol-1-/sugar-/sorbitol-6-/2-deoxyglucose-6-phosphatase
MTEPLKAVIFDMDGVLIDSEHLWRKAMVQGFGEFGMNVTEEQCRETMGQRFTEVVYIWLARFRKDFSPAVVETRVTDLLMELIEAEGRAISGIPGIIAHCRVAGMKTGLATSSSERLMKKVMEKLQLTGLIDAALSAEKMKYGKPHPQVFLDCAERLNVQPAQCLVIEDSLNGVIAGKAAGMKVIAVPDEGYRAWQQFAVADFRADDMHGVLSVLKELIPLNETTTSSRL